MFALLTVVATVTALSKGISLDALKVQFLVSAAIPFLVGIITHSRASQRVKTFTNLVASLIIGFITAHLGPDGGAWFDLHAVILAAFSWVTSVLTYLGVYSNVGPAIDNTGFNKSINHVLLPNFGLGKPIKAAAVVRVTPPVNVNKTP